MAVWEQNVGGGGHFHYDTIKVYGKCPGNQSGIESVCIGASGNEDIDWSSSTAIGWLTHEIFHGLGLGHDRTDGDCASRNGLMRAVSAPNAVLEPSYCSYADHLNCEGDGCPRHPALPKDPVADRPDLCQIVPELCVEPIAGVNNPWWMVSNESAPDCYLAIVQVEDTTTVERHCDFGGVAALNESASGPSTGLHHPSEGEAVGGTVQIDGWSLDEETGITGTLGFWIDGQPANLASVTYGEADSVACSGSQYPGCPSVGFSASLNTTGLSDGWHSFEVVTAEDVTDMPTPGYLARTFIVDNTLPTASFTAPAAGATVSGTIAVTVAASDTYGINLVSFYVDGVYKATDSYAPYSYSWDTATASNGGHTLEILAWDQAGHSRTVTRSVTTSNDLDTPQVSVTSPAPGALIRNTVNFRATATDNQDVTKVELYRDGQLLATDTSWPHQTAWDTTTGADGYHTLTAKAYDASGNVGVSTPSTVRVDNAAPLRYVDAPSHQQIVGGASVTVLGWVLDASQIVSYTFKVDGQVITLTNLVTNLNRANVCATHSSVPDPDCPYVGWSGKLDVTGFSNGGHTLSASFADAAGNTTTLNRSFVVDNPPVTAVFYPVADATAWQAYPTYNDGTSTSIVVRDPSGGNGAYAFVKFDVSGISGTILSAKLEVRTVTYLSELWLYWLVHNDWTENGITWSSFPQPGGTLGTARYNLASGSWYDFDVSSFVTGNGTFSMGFASSNAPYGYLSSRQSSYRPKLTITYQP